VQTFDEFETEAFLIRRGTHSPTKVSAMTQPSSVGMQEQEHSTAPERPVLPHPSASAPQCASAE